MRAARITTLMTVVAGTLLVASPALAWTCKAKNARGANYTAVGPIKLNVQARALAKCRLDSAAPASCHIVVCTP